jgi:hypothetical protein
VADAESLVKLGFDAFFITGVAPEWSTDIWGSDGEPWTIGRSDKNWQAVQRANARWTEYHCPPGSVMVNRAKQFKPSEEVCAYALCFARSDRARQAQIRLSGNDTWKLWVGGKLVRECAEAGRIILDREILPASLPAGTTPILVKVCNNRRDWGFVLRITAPDGKPVPGLKVVTR